MQRNDSKPKEGQLGLAAAACGVLPADQCWWQMTPQDGALSTPWCQPAHTPGAPAPYDVMLAGQQHLLAGAKGPTLYVLAHQL
jgi:hypothetical protein